MNRTINLSEYKWNEIHEQFKHDFKTNEGFISYVKSNY
jgi:hypothetical protein